MFLDLQLRLFWRKLRWFLECNPRILWRTKKANSSVPISLSLEDRKTVSAVQTLTLLEYRKAGSIVLPKIS
jgi:hypothetical protein